MRAQGTVAQVSMVWAGRVLGPERVGKNPCIKPKLLLIYLIHRFPGKSFQVSGNGTQQNQCGQSSCCRDGEHKIIIFCSRRKCVL